MDKNVKLVVGNVISKESFIEFRGMVYGKIKFGVCCVGSEYSTRFLNCSIEDVSLLNLVLP